MSARPPKIRYSHDGLIDMVVAEPWVSQNELAARFGYTPSWISTVMTSDAFKMRLEQRKDELVDPALRLSIEERFRAVTTRSLEVLMDKLAAPSASIPDNLVLQAAALGAKSLGMGLPRAEAQVPVEGHLEKLADRLLALQRGLGVSRPSEVVVEGVVVQEQAA